MARKTSEPPVDRAKRGANLKRRVKVTGASVGLATRMAGEKALGIKIDRAPHAAALRKMLGNLRGPIMKVAQLLATVPGALPDEYVEEFRQLQNQAPPMGWLFVKRRMASELGPDWESKFKSFEREASAAASLGQVHKAMAHDGTALACKLQYPDMASAIDADLSQLKFMMNIFESYDKAIKTTEIHSEIADRLREEVDYTHEAKAMALYGDILAGQPGVNAPRSVPELSTQRLLTMTWLDGMPLMDFKNAPQTVRNQIALNLFQAWYKPFYGCGVIHGDPHLGNYTIAHDHAINLLDFGCIRVFPPSFVRGVIDLYRALESNDTALAVHAYETWGFKNLTKDTVETLNIWAGFLYGPLLDNTPRLIGDHDDTGVYGRDTAHQVHQALRKHGGVTVPREFVFMDRAALGLGSVFLHLQAKINWYELFHNLIAGFDEKALAQRQQKMLQKHGLSKS